MWFLFAICTTLIWGLAEFFYKRGARPEEKYAHLKTCIFVGAVMGLHAVVTLCTGDFRYDPVNLIRYLPVSLLYIVSMACSFFGMRFIEESISDPIENTSGAICTVLCVIILGDTISVPAVAAIILMVAGILGLGFLDQESAEKRKKKMGSVMAVVAFAMPLVYAVLDAFGSFLDVFYLEDPARSPLLGVTGENIELVANTSYELSFAFCAVLLFLFLKVKKVPLDLLRQKDKILAALCETAGQFTYVYAMSRNGALSAPVISSVCVVSLILSRLFLGEKLSRRQYLFIALTITGIIALSVIEGDG